MTIRSFKEGDITSHIQMVSKYMVGNAKRKSHMSFELETYKSDRRELAQLFQILIKNGNKSKLGNCLHCSGCHNKVL